MFLGTYLVSITSGKRTAIPSIFRQNLGQSVIIAKWYENCLVLVSKGSWNALLERLTGGERMVIQPIRETEHFAFTSAFEVEVDDQGRIVFPDRVIAYANLKEQVYFLGVGDRIEIWNKESWEEKEKQVAKDAPKYVEQLSRNSFSKRSDRRIAH
jgi:MraZ protein